MGSGLPMGAGLQAGWLGSQLLKKARVHPGVLELLGFGRAAGAAQQGLGVAGLFVAPPVAAGLLVASTGVGAAARLWDESAAGEQGQLARAAAAVARLSVSLPMVVVLDDADRLDPDVALVMIENLIERHNGQVLVVATASPKSPLLSELTARARYGLTQGRVHTVDVDPGMGYSARVDLVKQLRPGLPAGAAERICQRTATFADVFDVASAERLTELTGSDDDRDVLTLVDRLVDARAHRAAPSLAAVIIGWAGGELHARQVESALDAVNGEPMSPDARLVSAGSVVRMVDLAAPDIDAETATLSLGHRRAMAEAILDQAEMIYVATDSALWTGWWRRARRTVSAPTSPTRNASCRCKPSSSSTLKTGRLRSRPGHRDSRTSQHPAGANGPPRQGCEGRHRICGHPAVHHCIARRRRPASASRGCARDGRRCLCPPGGPGLGGGEPA